MQETHVIGQTLGHYRIEDKLGEGGMGVVYRAVDTRLHRSVAVKVLTAEGMASPERRKRFMQEARAASALNHPNIVHIYDIDQCDGTDFIAMEYVAGQTLAQKINRKGLPLTEALKFAIPVAGALARAHAAGIVHRDLKPANIIIADDGPVKLLDFGLAKLLEPEAGDASATTRTIDDSLTEEGSIVGTVAYMSPEQAEGKKVDARSDIFSFGSVLYEMVTGRRAFEGATRISTLSAILHKDPQPPGGIAQNVPAELEKIIARCMRKDPERRTQHMGDIKLALEELREESESGKLASSVRVAPSEPRPPLRRRIIAASIVVAIAAAGLGWWLAHRSTAEPSNSNPVLSRLTNDAGLSTDPALSPDGKLLAYASDRATDGNLDIWVQQVSGGGAVRLTNSPADDRQPDFSPDGTRIAFRSERDGGGIYVIPALGAAEPRLIAERGQHPRFSPDGNWIAYVVGSNVGYVVTIASTLRLFVAPATGGPPKPIEPGFASAAYPIWLPDGKHLLFLGRRDASSPMDATLDWWVASLDGSPAVRTGAFEVFRKAGVVTTDPYYAPGPSAYFQGRAIFAGRLGDSTNLWQISLTNGPWRIEGPPRRLTFGTATEEDAAAAGPEGARLLVFASTVRNMHIWTFGIDANHGAITSPMQAVTQGPSEEYRPSISRDGNRVVYVSNRSGNTEVWLHDLSTGKDNAITGMSGEIDSPIFSPDGSQVAYVVKQNRKWNAYVMPITGGVPKKICEDILTLQDWSADGLLYARGRPSSVALLNLLSGASKELLKHPHYHVDRASLSVDGEWVVFRTGIRSDQDRTRIFVAPIGPATPVSEDKWIQIYEGEHNDRPAAAWSPDGRLIYLLLDRDGFRCLWAQRLDAATKQPLGAPFPVQHWHGLRRGVPSTGWGRSIGGGRFVFNQGETTGNLWMTRLD